MQDKNQNDSEKKQRGSAIWNAVNTFTAFLYSFFTQGRLSDRLSSTNTLCKRSFLAHSFVGLSEKTRKESAGAVSSFFERSRLPQIFTFIKRLLLSLKLNVYGTFFTFYGFAASVVYFLSVIVNGATAANEYVIITAVIIMLCAMPLLFTSQAVANAIMNSKIMRSVSLDFLRIPPEKLNIKKQYGGTGYVFFSAIIGMTLGALTYFLHPIFIPLLILCAILLCVIFSHPEAGVIITFAAVPFLQYVDNAKSVLLFMIVSTLIAYVFKVIGRRRTFALSPESTMVLIFCAFIIAAALFSAGGARTLADSVSTVIMIMGGFFLTYNLICSRELLSLCVKTLSISFVILSFVGLWNGFYNGISDRIMDDFSQKIAPIADNNLLYLADSGAIFGMFAVLIFPILMSHMTNRKKAVDIAVSAVFCIVAVVAAWMCSHYEIIVALAIEIAIFWLMYSHRSLTIAIFAAIPIAIVLILYPYAVEYFNWPDISEMLMEYMPASFADASIHHEVIKGTMDMLADGNLSGIGAGEHAFKTIFPVYSNAVSANAEDPSSLVMQILCWSGVFGLVTFAVFMVFVIKRSLGYFVDPYKKNIKGTAVALFCGIMTAILLGGVYSIWLDERVLYLFWACAGLLMGYIRFGRDSEEAKRVRLSNSANATDVELIFYE